MKRKQNGLLNSKDDLKYKWLDEVKIKLQANALRDPEIENKIEKHIMKSAQTIDQIPTKSMFFLFDNISCNYIHVSKSAVNVMGYSNEELTQKGFNWIYNIFPASELEYKKAVMNDVFDFIRTLTIDKILGCTVSYDLVVIRRDGKKIHILEELMFPVVSKNSEILITSCFIHDISNHSVTNKRHCEIFCETPNFRGSLFSKTYIIDQINSHPLSAREIQVLDKFSKGMSTREAADDLFVSENTIKTHRKNILFKLQVQNTTEAVRVGLKSNWIS